MLHIEHPVRFLDYFTLLKTNNYVKVYFKLLNQYSYLLRSDQPVDKRSLNSLWMEGRSSSVVVALCCLNSSVVDLALEVAVGVIVNRTVSKENFFLTLNCTDKMMVPWWLTVFGTNSCTDRKSQGPKKRLVSYLENFKLVNADKAHFA